MGVVMEWPDFIGSPEAPDASFDGLEEEAELWAEVGAEDDVYAEVSERALFAHPSRLARARSTRAPRGSSARYVTCSWAALRERSRPAHALANASCVLSLSLRSLRKSARFGLLRLAVPAGVHVGDDAVGVGVVA
jgi:hypothetical protein